MRCSLPAFLAILLAAVPARAAEHGARFAGRMDVVPDFCAAAAVNGAEDNTVCLQRALDEAARRGGGIVHLRGNALVSHLQWSDAAHGVWLEGEGSENGGDSSLSFTAGTEDGISIGAVRGGGIRDLLIDASRREGGAVIAGWGSQRFNVEHVYIDHPWLCFRFFKINHDVLQTVTCNQARGTGGAIEWDGDKEEAHRSDLLIISDTVVHGATDAHGATTSHITGLHLQGNVNSPVINGFRVIAADYGIVAEADPTGGVPFGGIFTDFESDFTTNEAVWLQAGDEWQFTNSYFNGGSGTANLITVGPQASTVMISNSKLLSANQSLVDIAGQGVSLTGNAMGVWGRTGAGFGAVHVEATARLVTMTGNFGGRWGGYGKRNDAPVLQVEEGADGVAASGNVFRGARAFSTGATGGLITQGSNLVR